MTGGKLAGLVRLPHACAARQANAPLGAVKTAGANRGGLILQALLKLSNGIDAFTRWTGKRLAWLILLAVVISAVNAIIRKTLDTSSNSWLELQWVLFSIVFLLCASWTLLDNEHIRIDIFNSMMPKRARNIIDIIGHIFFLIPLTVVMIVTRNTVLPALASDQRAIRQCGRPAAMAGQVAHHDRIRVPACSRRLRTDQADRHHARHDTGSPRVADFGAGGRSRAPR
ncbi:TRAP-type C4-dicarboxylate transport system permease small subunit [Bradyrhizobium sp. F1.13.4]